ncbi:hypothetical protein [Streptomyces sp. NPDC048248]|uniref:hypothetical protein n=1 Tax=Streptomyces sp. NPDC048248 TaxID=3365523 RepID=UPI003715A271
MSVSYRSACGDDQAPARDLVAAPPMVGTAPLRWKTAHRATRHPVLSARRATVVQNGAGADAPFPR